MPQMSHRRKRAKRPTQTAQAALLVAAQLAGPMAAVGMAAFVPVCVSAQVVADPNAAASRKPKVETASNGAVVVHIAPSSGAGVSHNLFSQFNISAPGVVLDNAATVGAAKSVLAGSISPNLLFGGSPSAQARLIVNEVSGGSPSALNGRLEVSAPAPTS